MRTHRAFSGLQPWVDPAVLRDLVKPEHLTVMRIEPIMRAREPAAILDLHFAEGGRHATVPLVLVDVSMLMLREADPLVFPQALAGALDDASIARLIETVGGELELRAFRGGMWSEEAVAFRDDPLFDRARANGWFGAAPLAVSIPRIAPAVYARRFAVGRTVLAFGPDAVEAAAFLRDVARRCELADAGRDADPVRYFGGGPPAEAAVYDLAVGSGTLPAAAAHAVVVRSDGGSGVPVSVVAPIPADVLISFDPDDGPVASSFTVAAAVEPAMRPAVPVTRAAVGGSAGRIALVLRPDAFAIADADLDEARAIAAGLEAEGFTVTLTTRLADAAAFEPDLVHLFGVRDGEHAAAVAAWAAEAAVPLAVHAYHEDPAAGGYWGAMVTRYCFAYSADDRNVTDYLKLLAHRAVEVDGVGAGTRYASPASAFGSAEAVIRDAALVFVQSERERDVVAAIRPAGATIVVPAIPSGYTASAEPVGSAIGRDPYVLVHGPIESAGNQLLVARAAATLGLPIVLAGPVADPAYAELVREFAGDGVRLLPEPSAGQAAALYRSAGIVADVAWMGRGHARVLEAARCGAATVLARNRWADLPVPEQWRVDPADVESVARGIGEAWDAVSRRDAVLAEIGAAAGSGGVGALRTIILGYAKIASGG